MKRKETMRYTIDGEKECTATEFAAYELTHMFLKIEKCAEQDISCELAVTASYIAQRAAGLDDVNSSDALSIMGAGMKIYLSIPDSTEIALPLTSVEENENVLCPIIDSVLVNCK